MGDNMKAFGTEILGMAKGLKDIQMATHTSDSSSMERHMAKESILGKMEKYMMANGIKASNKDTESGKECRMILISESGTLPRHMATECIPGPMATSMRDNGRCASSMDKERTLSYLGMSIRENMSIASHKEKDNLLGLIIKFIPVNSTKD